MDLHDIVHFDKLLGVYGMEWIGNGVGHVFLSHSVLDFRADLYDSWESGSTVYKIANWNNSIVILT